MARTKTVQTTLLPPEVVEARLRVGVTGAGDHVQCQIEVFDPGSGELLALWSDPHKPLSDLDGSVSRASAELVKILRELISPF